MWPLRKFTATLCLVAVTLTTIVPPQVFAGGWPFGPTTSVERLAGSIDRLERHLDQYGTVVIKDPDVWGQARLTKYRQEYEQVMAGQKDNFASTVNASISRADTAFLANAFALQAATSGSRASILGPPKTTTGKSAVYNTVQPPPLHLWNNVSIPSPQYRVIARDKDGNPIFETTSTTTRDAGELDPPDAPDDLTDLLPNEYFLGTPKPMSFKDSEIALEPTVMLDQRSRFLNHLHELRRISDGDDKSDAPGYALHLVRLPVSVLPGKRTQMGYGAEVSVIAKPHLHEQLLQDTFRGLVINDLVDQWSFPLAKFIDNPKAKEILEQVGRSQIGDTQKQQVEQLLSETRDAMRIGNGDSLNLVSLDPAELLKSYDNARRYIAQILEILTSNGLDDSRLAQRLRLFQCNLELLILKLTPEKDKFEVAARKLREFGQLTDANQAAAKARYEELAKEYLRVEDFRLSDPLESQQSFQMFNLLQLPEGSNTNGQGQDSQSSQEDLKNPQEQKELLQEVKDAIVSGFESRDSARKIGASTPDVQPLLDEANKLLTQLDQIETIFKEIQTAISLPTLSTTPSRRAQQPFPISLAFDVHCNHGLRDVALKLLPIKQDPHHNAATLVLDVQKVMAEEFNAAYEFLNHHEELWCHCSPELAAAIRRKDTGSMQMLCGEFRNSISVDTTGNPPLNHLSERQQYTIALAWAIIVESALLNERLVEDMQNLAAAKNAYCLRTDWLPYYGPNPPMEAIQAFNDYVQCRWPIHVVAIDPVTQDQNVADSFSQRRELQLALSLAFASGRINAQNFTRMARRLELDMETVALNRTVVGFSHGDDTFGWRFYPRVQSPRQKGNIATFAETLFTGGPGREAILNQSHLEPGIRECTAIVIMPSFVPYVVFDMRTNWFRLNNPAKKELDLRDGVGLSKEIVDLRCLTQECVRDQHLYRQDEVYRLTRAVDQLEERLPLQTTYVQMPFENSLGGFEFFNTGTPDLAPELKGFYGEPGLSQDRDTSIFLVGDHFSVHETQVIAGGQVIQPQNMQMLSRQIMRLTVTKELNPVGDFVDVHVATPYGVSNHIDIPILPKKKDEEAKKAADKAVSDHVEKKHVDQFSWKEDSADIQIVLDSTCQPQSAKLGGPAVIQNHRKSPFNNITGFRFRAWVKTFGSATDAKPKKVDGYLDFGVTGLPADWKETADLRARIAAEVVRLFQSTPLPKDTKKIQIEGFLALSVNGGKDIIKLENTLTLNVELCGQTCGSAAAASNDAMDTPFESPTPAKVSLPSSEPSRPAFLVPPPSDLKPEFSARSVSGTRLR
ncbi:MAG: hypothetical protein R3C18_04410 [Planctomycetaceae bacterium]